MNSKALEVFLKAWFCWKFLAVKNEFLLPHCRQVLTHRGLLIVCVFSVFWGIMKCIEMI